MYCHKIIHVESDGVICCYKQVKERSVMVEKYWEKQCLENEDHVIVCTNCGQVDGYELMKEFCSFHDNKCKITGRSISFRKFFLNRVVFNLTKKYDMIITTRNRNKAISVFEKINNVLPHINGYRKPMININSITILNDVQINIDYIKITKSKKPFHIITTTGTIY